MRWTTGGMGTAISLVLACATAAPATGQLDPVEETGVRRAPVVSVDVGRFGVEADSLGAGLVVELGFELPLGEWIRVRPSFARRTVAWPDGDRQEWLLDFGFGVERRFGNLSPFAEFTIGALFDLREEREFDEEYAVESYGTAAGLRWHLTESIGVHGRAHWRWIDGFDGGALATTAGIALRF